MAAIGILVRSVCQTCIVSLGYIVGGEDLTCPVKGLADK